MYCNALQPSYYVNNVRVFMLLEKFRKDNKLSFRALANKLNHHRRLDQKKISHTKAARMCKNKDIIIVRGDDIVHIVPCLDPSWYGRRSKRNFNLLLALKAKS